VKLRELAVLAILLTIQFMGPFSGNMIMPMFKALKSDFQVEIFLLSLSITLYMIPFSIFQLFAGFISDLLLGRKKTITIGTATYCIGSFLIASSRNIWTFIASRLIQGVGNALVTPMVMATVGDLYPREVRGRIMGLMAVSVTLGGSLGPLAGGYFASTNWRLGYLLLATLSGACAPLIHILMPKARSKGGGNAMEMLWRIKAIALNAKVMMLCSLGFILFFSRISFLTYLSDYLTLPPHSLKSEIIGAYLSLSGIGGIISGFITGFLADKVGRRRTSIIGFALYIMVLSAFLMPTWHEHMPILMLMLGFASTMSLTPINTLIVEVDPQHRGIAASMYGFIRFLGYASAPLAAYPLYKYALFQGVVALSVASLLAGIAIIVGLVRED